jgi:protein-disulfide isomerase
VGGDAPKSPLGYFITNTIIVLFFTNLMNYIVLINIFTLPYTVWSVWYQKKVKQWCPLCLIIQAILWLLFIVNYVWEYLSFSALSFSTLFSIGCLYITSILIINLIIPYISKVNKTKWIIQEINSLKVTDEVFEALLKKQPHFKVDKSASKILLGNPNSEILITVFTNPHCNPCSHMHKRIEQFLNTTNDKFCVQYIFSSFNEELESSSKFLINTYLSNPENSKFIFKEWFESGKNNKSDFFKKYGYNEQYSEEYDRHIQWKNDAKLSATPTILVNGYKLPENYKIEDLKYITNFNVNTK